MNTAARISAALGCVQSLNKKDTAWLISELRQLPDWNSVSSTTVIQHELFRKAEEQRNAFFGRQVYIRGLLEISSYCRRDCYYCGLRRSNQKAKRYRLKEEDILSCCSAAYEMGIRTFVLQGGEDPDLTEMLICRIAGNIKNRYPDTALTLSLGEWPRSTLLAFYNAGADRYLLRHESASQEHYCVLHPHAQRLENRKRCLSDLMDIGFQTGAGFMTGSPGQGPEELAEDLLFIKELHPHMAGIGPFIPHRDTPFKDEPPGDIRTVLIMLSLTRLMLPDILLPSTTALGSIHPAGQLLGLAAGANVVMPNISPNETREQYELYNGKKSWGTESAEGLSSLCAALTGAGFIPDFSKGNSPRERHSPWENHSPRGSVNA
ncbi:MAG: [FeFe] hydrogenase H-cluster radical SAM maturase HydE [Spirochaetaceae bacterium]|jgi:biotin synthase|nr:[FeFe] hydrogenase H-cluster radical SAM maturase HydE [Spirochaetaceae bacterium]